MDTALQSLEAKLSGITHPEELFYSEDTALPSSIVLERYLTAEYQRLREIATAANYFALEDKESANCFAAKLDELYREAQARLADRVYGLIRDTTTIPRDAKEFLSKEDLNFFKGQKLHGDGNYVYYRGYASGRGKFLGEVEIKLAATNAQNRLLDQETRILDLLQSKEIALCQHFPVILARFEAGGRNGAVLRKFKGLTLAELRGKRRFRHGIDPRDVVWMVSRLLGAMGYSHSLGVVHGNINPGCCLIQPKTHNAILLEWGQAAFKPAITQERISFFDPSFAAPEVQRGELPGPWSDIYSLGKTIIWTLGGDPARNYFGDNTPVGYEPIPEQLQQFILNLVGEAPGGRPTDAWAVYNSFEELKRSLWPIKWRNFLVD